MGHEIPGKALGSERRIYMGLGEAVLRLIHVENQYATASGVESEIIAERNLIVQALNQQYQLDLGFDCNADSVPDTVEIFHQTAKTSCCRILPMDGQGLDTGRKEKLASSRRVENLPDISQVKAELAKSPKELETVPEPVQTPEPVKGDILSRAIEKAFGGKKKERGSRKPTSGGD